MAIIVALTIVCTLLVYFNRDKIKKVIVTELNKQLVTDIKVSSIGIEFFSSFPQASLYLNNVTAFDAFPILDSLSSITPKNDTLFYFKKMYLTFNVWDIVSEKYEIKKIIAKNGQFNMKVRSNGDVNYIFWKPSQSKQKGNFSLSLNKIKLKDIKYSYKNDYSKQYYEIFLNDAIAKGNFTQEQQIIDISSDSEIRKIRIDNLEISDKRILDFDLRFSNNTLSKIIEIKSGDMKIDNFTFDVFGNLSYKQKTNINLSLKSKNINIEDMLSLLPNGVKKYFDEYESKGGLVFTFNMNGILDNKNMPSINSQFKIFNAELNNSKLGISFKNINLSGSFSNGKMRKSQTSYINIDNFSLLWNNGKIKGYAKLSNFSSLNLDAKLDCNLPIDALKRFLQNKEITQLSGLLNLNVELNGDLKNLGLISDKGLNGVKMKGKGSINKLNYTDARLPKPIINTDASFVFNNNSIIIENLKGSFGSSSISFSGEVDQILPYLFKQNKSFNLLGDLKVGTFNLNDFKKAKANNQTSVKETTQKTSSNSFEFPRFVNINVKTDINKLIYDKAEMKNFHARIKMVDGSVWFDEMSFDAFGGNINGNLLFSTNNSPKFVGDLSLSKVEAKKFLVAANEFNQNSITSKNIDGVVSAKVNFSAEMDKEFNLIKDRLSVNINYKIENGELTNVPLLKKLSYFVDESSLNAVKFSTLESNITINKSCVTIQEVNVKSNAVNFSIFGKHYLDNRIDYSLKMQLSELSSKKKKAKLEKERKEFGDFEEDAKSRMTMFVKIGGTLDKPIFSYDAKRNIERAKLIIKEDKVKIANSIDKDFKLGIKEMKKDKEDWKKQEKGEYIIDWEGDKVDSNKINKKENIKNKETKFNIEWE